MDQDALKVLVAKAACEKVRDILAPSVIIGIGTGSTANCFIDELAESRHRFRGAVASSMASAERLLGHGVQLFDLNEVDEMEVYVDGADETDHERHLIKGGGGALTREKIVASCSRHFICIVDESKVVDALGAFPLPLEVIPMARRRVEGVMRDLGGDPVYREGFVTDNGNHIVDVHDLTIDDPVALEAKLNSVVGIVTNGIFAERPADLVLVGTASGVEELA